ncbi:MAG: hypothetical protein KAI66_07580, partial [Lentisphaeria bacterium]|nr:hypothetical protein [Lentisphaeria bacterium]
GGPDEQFEGRVVQGMRSEAQGDNKTVPVLARRGTRVALRVALAVLFLALLGVRSLNLRYFRNDSWSAQALSALGQVFLREPSVETPNRLPYGINQDQRRLAIAHQLTKGFAGLLMWLSLLLLVLFLARDLWVVRTRLRA